MATEYDLKLVVDADTSEAQRKLDALGGGQGGRRPQPSPTAPGGAGVTGGSGGSTSPSRTGGRPATPSPAAVDAARRVEGEYVRRTSGGRTSTSGAGEFGRAAGDVAGRMIGKAVAGFVAHQVASTVFSAMKTPGGDNRNVNMAESVVGGALQYGTMGAMVG